MGNGRGQAPRRETKHCESTCGHDMEATKAKEAEQKDSSARQAITEKGKQGGGRNGKMEGRTTKNKKAKEAARRLGPRDKTHFEQAGQTDQSTKNIKTLHIIT